MKIPFSVRDVLSRAFFYLGVMSAIIWLINLYLLDPYPGLIGEVRMIENGEELMQRVLAFPTVFAPLLFLIVSYLLLKMGSE